MAQQMSVNLTPVIPALAIAAIAVALGLLLLHGSMQLLRKHVPVRWVTVLAVIRSVAIVVLVLCLLQPMISYARTEQQRPDLLVMVDTSKSMGAAGADGRSRLDAATALLGAGRLPDSIRNNFNIRWFAFDRTARPVQEADLTELKADGDSTRLVESLSAAVAFCRQAESQSDSAGRARVLLVSDGNDLGSGDVVETSRKLGIAVDVLAPGDDEKPGASAGSVAIATVQSPRRVLLGSETQITATLRADGPVAPTVQLSLVEGGAALANQSVTFRPGEAERTVTLSHRPAEIGLRKYELRLADPAAASTKVAATYPFSVSVAEDKNQVLVLEDNWRWELKFLRRVIEDDPSFSFTALLSRNAGGGGMHVQLAEADRKMTIAGFPQSGADLAWFDTMVLGDVSPKQWPPALAAGIARAVKEEGKGLVVIAGPNLAAIAEVPELGALLPVEVTRESAQPIDGPVVVRPSREGAQSPFFFNLGAGALPPLDRVYPPLRKRPAATILMETATRANAYGKLIVLAEQTVGRGRVLFIGTDCLWNWQMTGPLDAQGVTPYAAFWQQALRALAPQVTSGSSGVTLSLQSERSRYEVGERVVVRAQYQSASAMRDPAWRASITTPDAKQLALPLDPDPRSSNTYRGEFEATQPGQYKITASIASRQKSAVAEAFAAIDVQPQPSEASGAGVNRANLARIAQGTHGKMIRVGDPSSWPTSEAAQRYPVRQVRHVNLWSNLTLLIVLCGLLGTDWFLRLLRGYV